MNVELEVASWRRLVGELYAAVRAEDDPERGHSLWRHGRDELFTSHPQNPLPPGDPLRATGLPYWPYDPRLRFEVPVRPAGPQATLPVPTSGWVTSMTRVGQVHLPAPVDVTVDVWWLRQYAGACSFRCATVPRAGRATGAGGTRWTLIIDLNFLYHPSCRYNDAWQCPLAPPGNTTGVSVNAGERLPA